MPGMMAITINVPVAAHGAFSQEVTCAAFLDQFHHLIHYHYKALTEAQRFFCDDVA